MKQKPSNRRKVFRKVKGMRVVPHKHPHTEMVDKKPKKKKKL